MDKIVLKVLSEYTKPSDKKTKQKKRSQVELIWTIIRFKILFQTKMSIYGLVHSTRVKKIHNKTNHRNL